MAGWQTVDIPVSVDKIGIFFREMWPSSDTDLDLVPPLPIRREPVRLIFVISLNDIQKVVNVRSALVLSNTMEIPLEIKLEPNSDLVTPLDSKYGQEKNQSVSKFSSKYVTLPILAAKGHLAIPLHLTSWDIYARPQHWGVQYCDKHLAWKHLVGGMFPTSHMRSCDIIGAEEELEPPFRFCVSVQRENYPVDAISSTSLSSSYSPSTSSSPFPRFQPAHTLTLFPPYTITNLLPCDIQFSLVESKTSQRGSSKNNRRIVHRGQDVAVYSVSSQSAVMLNLALEGFEKCQGCVVSAEGVGIPQSMVMEDHQGRPLRLTVSMLMIGGGAIKVRIGWHYICALSVTLYVYVCVRVCVCVCVCVCV